MVSDNPNVPIPKNPHLENDDDLMEWVEVDGIKYATQQEVAVRIRELEAERAELIASAKQAIMKQQMLIEELAALRQQQGEPVAWRREWNGG